MKTEELIEKIASRLHKKYGHDKDDLIQVGRIAAWKNEKNWKQELGMSRVRFMHMKIEYAIIEFIRCDGWTTRSQQKAGHKHIVSCDFDFSSVDMPPDESETIAFALARRLPDCLKTTFILYFLEQKTLKEVGNIVGLSESGVSLQIKKARQILRSEKNAIYKLT